MEFSLKAHAKCNVGLKVGEKRDDGYHPLCTYFHLISLSDTIHFDIRPSKNTKVSITGNEEYAKIGVVDLMERAALLYSKERDRHFYIQINIDKHIPFGAGLGGGSSDAATVLKALATFYEDKESLQDMALKLGSDVPFFTSGYTAAKGEGRGEILTPIEPVSAKAALLMPKAEKVSTLWAFSELDKRKSCSLTLPPWSIDSPKWYDLYENDFLQVQSESECMKKREKYRLMLSGSGACFYTIVDSVEKGKALIEDFSSTDVYFVHFLTKR